MKGGNYLMDETLRDYINITNKLYSVSIIPQSNKST